MARHRRSLLLLAAVLITSLLGWAGPAAAGSAPSREDLQGAFAAAAAEFGVPESVLLAVSYDESRWEQHDGRPSVSGGYGPMHLTDVPAGATDDPVASEPGKHTLRLAASLLDANPETLQVDPVQNLRGGAALLARYARETTGTTPSDPGAWYGAIAAYRGARQADVARGFADTVMTTLRRGAARTLPDGQRIVLPSTSVVPDPHTADALYPPGAENVPAECPEPLLCGSTLAVPGNFHLADRPDDDLDIRYIVIHDTEGTSFESLRIFQDPLKGTSANYLVRADGVVVQIVPTRDIAHHAGNWYLNSHSIGVEHEGYSDQGATWYDEQLYQTSARLVRYLAAKYGVPLDRAHIIGHDNVPGQTPESSSQMHWDPGPYWDWAHYMDLLGAPIEPGAPSGSSANSAIVTIAPSFADNLQAVDDECEAPKVSCPDLPVQPANFVRLYRAPSFDAPLLAEPSLARLKVAPGQGTTLIDDWGDSAVTGESFYRVDQRGDWDAIWFAGQKAWFYNPGQVNTRPGDGLLVTPRAGHAPVCVYGEAYPAPSDYPDGVRPAGVVPLQCNVATGQIYVASDEVSADYAGSHTVVRGATRYYQIFYNHRLGFVRVDDMSILPSEAR